MAGINRLIQDSFDRHRWSKRATVLSLSAVAFTAITTRASTVDPLLGYLLLYWAAVLVCVLSGRQEDLLAHPAWRLRNIWKPIGLGVSVCLFVYSALLLVGNFSTQGSFSELLMPTLAWGLMVGVIETFLFHWVLLGTLPYSPVTSNVIFALLHPLVLSSMAGGASAGFFVFLIYFGFGLFMTLLVMWYENTKYWKGSEWGGPMLAMVVHCSHNVFVTIFVVSMGGMQLVPF